MKCSTFQQDVSSNNTFAAAGPSAYAHTYSLTFDWPRLHLQLHAAPHAPSSSLDIAATRNSDKLPIYINIYTYSRSMLAHPCACCQMWQPSLAVGGCHALGCTPPLCTYACALHPLAPCLYGTPSHACMFRRCEPTPQRWRASAATDPACAHADHPARTCMPLTRYIRQ